MITEVDLSGTPCFAPGTKLTGLRTFNFIFGPNGSGKTTISNHIGTMNFDSSNSEIEEVAVFNRDYIREAFRTRPAPGHITLGKDSSEAADEIDRLTTKLNELRETHATMRANIEAAKKREDALRKETQRKLTARRKALAQILSKYDGVLPSRRTFIPGTNAALLNKMLSHESQTNQHETTTQHDIDSIIEQIKLIPKAGATEVQEPQIPQSEYSLEVIEELLRRIPPLNTDSEMAAFASAHHLTDWISKGLDLLVEEEIPTCPFCQRELTQSIITGLKNLFNTERDTQLESIKQAKKSISQHIEQVSNLIEKLRSDPTYNSIDFDGEIQAISDALTNVKLIEDRIELKELKPSTPLSTGLASDPMQDTEGYLNQVSNKVKSYNQTIQAGRQKRTQMLTEVENSLFDYLTFTEFQTILAQHKEKLDDIIRCKPSSTDINRIESEITATQNSIKAEETKLTSVGSKMEFINELLTYIGFTSFSLITPPTTHANNDSASVGQYVLIRHAADSTNVPIDTSTLSEGERTLLTFLYFITKYYDDSGSPVNTTHLPRTLLVIDDPIASTDAETFFLITNIIRQLLKQVSDFHKIHPVKQVVVTSHNTRFLKEVAYSYLSENNNDDNIAGFYLISKTDDGSVISGPEATSRITNEYNDLWAEIRRCRNLIKSTQGRPVPSPKLPLLGNVMRRIIESYFLDIGEKGTITSLGLSTNKKVAILLAFCNSTSHSAIGSEIYEISSWKPMQLLNAFEEVFSTIDDGAHRGHYEMMMRARTGDPTFS